MISILVGILVGVAAVAALVGFLVQFAPSIISWFNSSVEAVTLLLDLLPSWVTPIVLTAVALALVSLGVKLL